MIRDYLTLPLPHLDCVLFTNYRAKVATLLDRTINVAWNGAGALATSIGIRDANKEFWCANLVCRNDKDNNAKSLPAQTSTLLGLAPLQGLSRS
jgi:hypothetical protein